jgi:hypothetical protein
LSGKFNFGVYQSVTALLDMKHRTNLITLLKNWLLCTRLVHDAVIFTIYNLHFKYTFPLLFVTSKTWCIKRQKLCEQCSMYSNHYTLSFCSLLQTPSDLYSVFLSCNNCIYLAICFLMPFVNAVFLFLSIVSFSNLQPATSLLCTSYNVVTF